MIDQESANEVSDQICSLSLISPGPFSWVSLDAEAILDTLATVVPGERTEGWNSGISMGLEPCTLAEDPWVECFCSDTLLFCRLSLSNCWKKDLLILVPGNTGVFMSGP